MKGIMNSVDKNKINAKSTGRVSNFLLALLLISIAGIAGIQFGNFLYGIDTKIIRNIDTNNFKNAINSSLPIIETVYNSGKRSVSLSGEMKSLFSRIFAFDIDTPVTILNVQSPLFKSYYNSKFKSMLSLDGNSGLPDAQDMPGSSDSPGASKKEDGQGSGIEDTGNGEKGSKEGADDLGAGSGGSPGQDGKDGGAGSGGNPEQDGKDGAGKEVPGADGKDSGSEENEDDRNNNNNGAGSGDLIDLQPISSITYEQEDEIEDESDLVALDKIVLRNFTKHKIDIAKLLQKPIKFDFSKKGPKVLIYQTHTTESYVLKESDLGKKGVPSFNTNPKYNVVRIGEELARNLKKYGIDTLHNGTVHDKKHDAAYGASLKTLQSYMKSYPSIQLAIDIHRDAIDPEKPKLRAVKQINGRNAAQIMFVMGTGELLPNPHWEENLKLAVKLQQKLNEKYPGLTRPLWVTRKRYNQHVSKNALLIEIGGDGNLLSECLESTKYLAEALNDIMNEK